MAACWISGEVFDDEFFIQFGFGFATIIAARTLESSGTTRLKLSHIGKQFSVFGDEFGDERRLLLRRIIEFIEW